MRGIIIVGGSVVETVAVPVQTSLMKNEQVGDGVGFFDSGDIKMDGTTVESNARAAGVLDNALSSIIIVGGKVQFFLILAHTKRLYSSIFDALADDDAAPIRPLADP